MATVYLKQIFAGFAIAALLLGGISCRVVTSSGEFYGSTTPPQRNILRYVSGDDSHCYYEAPVKKHYKRKSYSYQYNYGNGY